MSAPEVTGSCDGSVAREAIWAALEQVEDPELPLSVTDLGLVRRIAVRDGHVRVGLTYTSIACPCTDLIREDVRDAVAAVADVVSVEVDDVLEPWSRNDITPHGLELLRAVAVVQVPLPTREHMRRYEVFARHDKQPQLCHIGQVEAGNDEDAAVFAYTLYDERRWQEMFVVPQSATTTLVRPR